MGVILNLSWARNGKGLNSMQVPFTSGESEYVGQEASFHGRRGKVIEEKNKGKIVVIEFYATGDKEELKRDEVTFIRRKL